MALIRRHRQIAFNTGTPGSFTAGTLAAPYAKLAVYDLTYSPTINKTKRKPQGLFLSSPASGAATGYYTVSFKADLAGSGTAGTAPVWGLLLKACGYSETVSGAASYTQPTADSRNSGTSAVPTIAGTWGGTSAADIEITVVSKTATPDTLVFSVISRFLATSTFDAETASVTDATAFDIPDGAGASQLNAAVAPDFATFYTAVREGDRWTSKAFANAQVLYALEEPAASATIPVLDLAVLEGTTSAGQVLSLRDARGNVKFNFGSTSGPGVMEFDFTGIIAASPSFTSQALLSSITYPDVIPPTFKGITTSFFSGTPQAYTNIMLDTGNTVSPEEDAQATHGYNTTAITDRESTGSINPLRAVPATFESSAKFLSQTLGALTFTVGATAGNIHAFNIPKVQLSGDGDEDREGRSVSNLSFDIVRPDYAADGDYDTIKLTLT